MVEELSPKNNPNDWWQPSLRMFVRLSSWIVAPVLIGSLIGRWLDKKYQTEPKWFLIVVGLSFIISMFGLIKNSLEEYKKIK